MTESSVQPVIYMLDDPEPVWNEPPSTDYRQKHAGTQTAIIIDNGASEIRVGWADESEPRFIFDNVGAKFKDRKTAAVVMLYGNNTNADATSRSAARSPFENDVVVNFDMMEIAFDFIFTQLGIDTDQVEHPIVMTEALCNPIHCRSLMTELLFEGYGVPSITYGLDSLFSAHNAGITDGIVISSGHNQTRIVPVLNSKADMQHAKRMSWGGLYSADYLLKLLQLKYPTFPTKVTPAQAMTLVKDHTYTSIDFETEISDMRNPTKICEINHIIQFPFVLPTYDEKTEEELARAAERRQETAKKMQESLNRQRLEKIVKKEGELTWLLNLRDYKNTDKKADYIKRIKAEGYEERELESLIAKTESFLKKARNKELGIDEVEVKEIPNFNLVDVPDHSLDEEQIREKRRQRLMKAGYDARIRAREEKEKQRVANEEEERKQLTFREEHKEEWLQIQRSEYEAVIKRIKEQKQLKAQLGDRKSAAAQARMKNIASLADDRPNGADTKKRKRGGNDDNFGASDADWQVYKNIGNNDNESEDEDEDPILALTLEAKLLEHDPTFTIEHTQEGREAHKNSLLTAFLRGGQAFDAQSYEHSYQIHLNIERPRIGEVFHQPSLAGLDQASISELVHHVLRNYDDETRKRLASNIHVSGRHTLFPGFADRLKKEIVPVITAGCAVSVTMSGNARTDAWCGMAKWATVHKKDLCGSAASVTRSEYDTVGSEAYRCSHNFGNIV